MRAGNLVLIAAIVAGVSYIGSSLLPLPPAGAIAWKGAGVGLLALYAALNARSVDGWLLVAVMVFGALGDVLLETHGFVTGGAAFFLGHFIAIGLYLKNRRGPLIAAEWVIAVAVLVLVPVASFVLPLNRGTAGPIGLYGVGLAAMAAAAWVSRFPRTLVFAGAMMFVVSDLLIFVRAGRPALQIPPIHIAVWGLYFAGQALIAIGVRRRLG